MPRLSYCDTKIYASLMLQFLLLEEMAIDSFWGGKTKVEAVNRMKNTNLSKQVGNYSYIKKIYYSDVK